MEQMSKIFLILCDNKHIKKYDIKSDMKGF